MGSILEFWRGGVPLGQAFWLWGLLGGAVINLFATLLMVFLLTAGAPAWIAAVLFAAHLPVNVLLLVGVWRSAGRPEVGGDTAALARVAMVAWVAVLMVA
jgi:hypothetical protein